MAAILIAQFVAIPTGFILASYNAVFSQNVMPHLYQLHPSVTTPMFAKIFNLGATTITPLAAAGVAANLYLAYSEKTTERRRLYLASAVLMLSTLPLTAIVMKPGINRLIEISTSSTSQASAAVHSEVGTLLRTWASQNYFRASLHFTAGTLGMYAALS